MYNKTFNFTQKNLKNIYNKKYIKIQKYLQWKIINIT